MGFDYALVHATYTIPPAIFLSILYAPLCTRIDLYKIAFLITIAVVATIPWDSYLIRTRVWSYPSNVVVGLTLFDIPVEEVFFFVIQTFNTTLLYHLLNKPILHPVYLIRETGRDHWRSIKIIGQVGLGLAVKKGIDFVRDGGDKTYLGLIVIWAGPFLFLLWSLAYQLLVQLPPTSTLVPILLPTLYLWIVDTLALKRGTWVISQGTKTGVTLWPGLEIEEALFFLLTNTLIVAGLVAFDNALAILTIFPSHFRGTTNRNINLPSPALLVRALLLPSRSYDDDRILALQQSTTRLHNKSRSFYLASSAFPGRLRLDLIMLYSFCRVADDLIDNAASASEARGWIGKLKTFLALSYQAPEQRSGGGGGKGENGTFVGSKDANQGAATLFVVQHFPPDTQLTLLMLPTERMSREPLDELVKGLEMDLAFASNNTAGGAKGESTLPIKGEAELELYSARVAGTVALLCIELVLFHYPLNSHNRGEGTTAIKAKRLMAAGHDMGIALQCTNIARDFLVDARVGRCYVPPSWLKKEKLTTEGFVNGLLRLDSASGFASATTSASSSQQQQDKSKTSGSSTTSTTNNSNTGSTTATQTELSDTHAFFAKKVELIRSRMLDKAASFYERSVAAIEELPAPARAPMRVAVESYMQIARELRKKTEMELGRTGSSQKEGSNNKRLGKSHAKFKAGRATVPVWLRVWVAYRALWGPRKLAV